ncbi:ABC transporter substrate-binding protein [Nonomuraea guangzhouensis]|uniref:ABC transporter substrate-binding protein n=1 Tax=Nonomuraea guangzhouensis TaxID=1291555 RepID=A0ABW4FZ99_9ACTN|nr:ABC transporter substrate-binding protein [Nonomuraea guangzhouensis]
MRIRVLGAIEIQHGDGPTRLTAPKECALLAALLTTPNEPVPTVRLIDALWTGDPPPSAGQNLRLYVARLRRRLGDADRIAHLERGYALMAQPEEVDALRFEESLDRARASGRADGTTPDPAHVAAMYREALALWRGSAFEGADLGSGPAQDYAVRLDELRAAAIEEWIDVELDLGHHRSLVGELRGLTSAHPLRERLHARLMLALYRSGRQAEALDAYRAARKVVVAELGLEPGPELRALEAAILAADPSLDPVEPAPVKPSAAVRPARTSRIWRVAAGLILVVAAAVYVTRSTPERPSSQPTATMPQATPALRGAKGDGVLTVGTLLPRTGLLSFIGPSISSGAKLAVEDVNAAGGILGKPVRLLETDSGDVEPDIGVTGAEELIDKKADLIVGPASNTLSLDIMDKVADAGAAMISPAATSDRLTMANDQGMFFRTAAADTLEGTLLGQLAAEDGNRSAMIITLEDSYDSYVQEVADSAEQALATRGVALLDRLEYPPATERFAGYASQISKDRPEALIMIGFDETISLVRALHKRGLTAQNQHWYLVDANLLDYSDEVPAKVMAGAKGLLAGADATGEFAARMEAADPKHHDTSYGVESYDAVVLGALAAESAQSDRGQSIAAHLADVSSGGRRCVSYRDCAALVRAGVDIDYDGLSGRIEFDSNGDVREGKFGIYQYDESNMYQRVATHLVKDS